LANLHYSYVNQLLNTAKSEIDGFHHKDALMHISKALSHIDVLVKSQKIRGDIPLNQVEERRIELIDLVNQLPPTYHD